MKIKPIPQINQDFDLGLLYLIFKKNIFWIVISAFICGLLAFLILRYTKPVYISKAEIQLTNDESANSILRDGIMSYPEENLAKEIELIRSPVFIKRVINRLPLSVSYYNDGRFLDFDTYGSSFYGVTYKIQNPAYFGTRFELEVNADKSFELQSSMGKNKVTGKFNDTINFDGIQLHLKENATPVPGNYFFIINDSLHLVKSIISNLQVTILNSAAKTIEISYKDNSNRKCKEVVNAIALEFESFNIEKKQDGANKIISFIDNALVLVTDQLNQTDEELSKNFSSFETNPYFMERQSTLEGDKISVYQKELVTVEKDLEAIKILQGKKINNRNDLIQIQAVIAGTSLERYLESYLNSIQTSFLKKEELSYSAPEKSPLMESVNFTLKNQIDAFENSLEAVQSIIQTKQKDLQVKVNSLRTGISSSGSVNDTTDIDLSKLRRLRAVNEKYFNQLVEKRAEMVFVREGITPEYQILAFGVSSNQPQFPNQNNIILLALVVWIFFCISLIGLKYIFHDEIISAIDVEKYTDAPILGIVHKYNEYIPVSQLVVDKNPKGLMAEAFRALRTNMAFINNDNETKIISITSTISGEGKTFVAINLSGIIAYSKARVVLIDCDMRKPKIHVGFEVPNTKGISTILTNQSSLDECIMKSDMEHLDFITAGPPPPNPAELLISTAMDNLVEELKKRYDYIVMDNPPAGIVSDAIVNMKRSHYPIYVVRSSYSRKFFINNINHLILDNQIEKLSVVLNGMDFVNQATYGYGSTKHGYGVYTYGSDSANGYGYYVEEASLGGFKKPFLRRIFGARKK